MVLVAVPMLYQRNCPRRLTAKNPVGAVRAMGGSKLWLVYYALPLIVTFVVLSYYSVIAGWRWATFLLSLFSIKKTFSEFIANPVLVISLGGPDFSNSFHCIGRVFREVLRKPPRFWCRCFCVTILVIFRSITLSCRKRNWILFGSPDFFKKSMDTLCSLPSRKHSFSLGVGWGMMITYGSTFPKPKHCEF